MFNLLILLLLQSCVLAAPVDKRAYVFVSKTLAPVYVTINAQGANQFVTMSTGVPYYSTQWPASQTPTPAPAAAPIETSDYNTVLVSDVATDPTPQIVNSLEGKNPVSGNSQPAKQTSSSAENQPSVPETSSSVDNPSIPSETSTPIVTQTPTTSQTETSTPIGTQTLTTSQAVTVSDPAQTTSPEASTQTASDSQEPTTSTDSTTVSSSVETTAQSTSSTSTTSLSTAQPTQPVPSGSVTPPDYIVYSPYLNNQGCKDYDTVLGDLQLIKSKGINKLRTYGTDCNVLNTIVPAAQSLGMVISQGINIGPAGLGSAVDQSVSDIIAYGQAHGWGVFESIIFGNEDIVNNYVTASDLINAAAGCKSQLQAAGFNGLFMHAEVTDIIQDNPDLCGDVFDVVALNAHSYFDAYSTAPQSGEFVKGQVGIVQSVCGAKRVWVSETGYPSQGLTNGGQVPTKENQLIAVQSIMDVVGQDVVLLTTFNDMWKSPGPYGVEQYFGVIDILA